MVYRGPGTVIPSNGVQPQRLAIQRLVIIFFVFRSTMV
jgi:hypothetical protein